MLFFENYIAVEAGERNTVSDYLEEVDYDFANQDRNGYNYGLTNDDIIHILNTVKNS